MKSVGIDIGSYSIKVVEAQTSSKGFQLLQYFEHPLSISPGSDPEIEILEFLRDLSRRYNPAQTRFVFCLRQDKVAVRNKTFPFADRIKIAKSLSFELEEDIPFSADNAIFDAKIIRTLGSNAEVLACAAPKHHIKSILQLGKDSGLDPFLISAEGIAFGNFHEKWNELPPSLPVDLSVADDVPSPKRMISIVLNIGHTHTLAAAFDGESLVGVKSIFWGGKNIAEAISKKYEIPYIEAMKELQTKAFILTNKQGATFDQITFSDLISQSIREMVRDLQLYLLEYRSELNAEIIKIGLTGGPSQILNLGPFLTQMLELPVNKISTLGNFSNILFEVTPAIDATISTSLGLAIEGLKKPRNPPLNFLRAEFTPKNTVFIEFIGKWGHSIKIGVSALVAFFIFAYFRDEFALQLSEKGADALKNQAKNVAHLNGKQANEAGINKYIKSNKERAVTFRRLSSLSRMTSALDVLKRVSEACPAGTTVGMDLKNFKLEDTKLIIEGYVRNQTEVSLLQKSLINVSRDGKVLNERTSLRSSGGKVAFGFSLNVDRGVEKVTK